MAILEHRTSERRRLRPLVRSGRAARASQAPCWSLEDQVERAALLQRRLLPDLSAPLGDYRLAGLYCPCEALGGDFYDLARFRDRAVLLVSDVMGHGVEAALTTPLVKAVFQEAAGVSGQPLAILDDMHARLSGMIPEGVFVAAAVVTLDLRERTLLRLANAGLPHPFVLRAGSRKVRRVAVNGLPLGLFGERGWCRHEATTVHLAAGDVLLIASDGLGAIESETRECFEDGHLLQALSRVTGRDGKEVIRSLINEASDFSGVRPQPDDINLVSVTRKGELEA